jgi:hypothetical protein
VTALTACLTNRLSAPSNDGNQVPQNGLKGTKNGRRRAASSPIPSTRLNCTEQNGPATKDPPESGPRHKEACPIVGWAICHEIRELRPRTENIIDINVSHIPW